MRQRRMLSYVVAVITAGNDNSLHAGARAVDRKPADLLVSIRTHSNRFCDRPTDLTVLGMLEPKVGFEPTTVGLRIRESRAGCPLAGGGMIARTNSSRGRASSRRHGGWTRAAKAAEASEGATIVSMDDELEQARKITAEAFGFAPQDIDDDDVLVDDLGAASEDVRAVWSSIAHHFGFRRKRWVMSITLAFAVWRRWPSELSTGAPRPDAHDAPLRMCRCISTALTRGRNVGPGRGIRTLGLRSITPRGGIASLPRGF